MKSKLLLMLACVVVAQAQAGSATWSLNPDTTDWNTASNWTPATVPNGPDDIATFGVSNLPIANVSIYETEVGEIIFNPGASAYTLSSDKTWYVSGLGITNNSGITQTFAVGAGEPVFTNSAKAGENTFFALAGYLHFFDTASADHGTFVLNGSPVAYGGGAVVSFSSRATAGSATFTVNGGSVPLAHAAAVDFFDNTTAADGVFVLNGGSGANADGGEVIFGLGVIAGKGIAGNGTFIANPGTDGGYGGRIRYYNSERIKDTSTARMELFGNGSMDISYGIENRTVGSIEGDGLIYLGGAPLTVGTDNLSTTFAGIIQDSGVWGGAGGSIIKTGDATLALTGASTYTGGTTIEGGKLLVSNQSGSGTGSGLVEVNAGSLGGSGVIAGAVVVGIGSGSGAILTPGVGLGRQNTLTIQSELTFNRDGSYACTLNTKRAIADQVRANGVTINGARCVLRDSRGLALSPGTALTVIDNTSANAISGTFSNLPEGGTIAVGVNRFLVSYKGGDGNDLTLTVVP